VAGNLNVFGIRGSCVYHCNIKECWGKNTCYVRFVPVLIILWGMQMMIIFVGGGGGGVFTVCSKGLFWTSEECTAFILRITECGSGGCCSIWKEGTCPLYRKVRGHSDQSEEWGEGWGLILSCREFFRVPRVALSSANNGRCAAAQMWLINSSGVSVGVKLMWHCCGRTDCPVLRKCVLLSFFHWKEQLYLLFSVL
jgi:hypothetical protein